jgi:hypothetical protein
MKRLLLSHDYKSATAVLKRQCAAPSHMDQTIDQDTVVIAPDGKIIAVFLKGVIEPDFHSRAYKSWKTINELPDKRATAAGSLSLPRIRKDGTLGERSAVPKRVLKVLKKQGVRHGMLGYLDATPDKSCHKTPLTKNHPKMLDRNKTLIEMVDKLYEQYLRQTYATQWAEVEKVPRWRLWDTAFTTIYLAKNFRTAYHRDSGNLKGVMTALMPMGHFSGGELVLPRWRIAFALKPGDLLFFDPQQLHGNLPFEGKRLSAAFYCERRIADCGK